MKYEKADLFIGIVIVVIGAAAMMGFTAAVFAGTHRLGQFTDTAGVADRLEAKAGKLADVLFAIALLDASIIGAFAMSLSTAYAIGDVLGMKHSLHRGVGGAKGLYAVYAGLVAAAAAIVLIPGSPLGLLAEGVQTLAGVLSPSASVFLLLLCNDKQVLGPWVNGPQTNATGKGEWRMPPFATLTRPTMSTARKIGMGALRTYLLIAMILVVIKIVQVALGNRTPLRPGVPGRHPRTGTIPLASPSAPLIPRSGQGRTNSASHQRLPLVAARQRGIDRVPPADQETAGRNVQRAEEPEPFSLAESLTARQP